MKKFLLAFLLVFGLCYSQEIVYVGDSTYFAQTRTKYKYLQATANIYTYNSSGLVDDYAFGGASHFRFDLCRIGSSDFYISTLGDFYYGWYLPHWKDESSLLSNKIVSLQITSTGTQDGNIDELNVVGVRDIEFISSDHLVCITPSKIRSFTASQLDGSISDSFIDSISVAMVNPNLERIGTTGYFLAVYSDASSHGVLSTYYLDSADGSLSSVEDYTFDATECLNPNIAFSDSFAVVSYHRNNSDAFYICTIGIDESNGNIITPFADGTSLTLFSGGRYTYSTQAVIPGHPDKWIFASTLSNYYQGVWASSISINPTTGNIGDDWLYKTQPATSVSSILDKSQPIAVGSVCFLGDNILFVGDDVYFCSLKAFDLFSGGYYFDTRLMWSLSEPFVGAETFSDPGATLCIEQISDDLFLSVSRDSIGQISAKTLGVSEGTSLYQIDSAGVCLAGIASSGWISLERIGETTKYAVMFDTTGTDEVVIHTFDVTSSGIITPARISRTCVSKTARTNGQLAYHDGYLVTVTGNSNITSGFYKSYSASDAGILGATKTDSLTVGSTGCVNPKILFQDGTNTGIIAYKGAADDGFVYSFTCVSGDLTVKTNFEFDATDGKYISPAIIGDFVYTFYNGTTASSIYEFGTIINTDGSLSTGTSYNTNIVPLTTYGITSLYWMNPIYTGRGKWFILAETEDGVYNVRTWLWPKAAIYQSTTPISCTLVDNSNAGDVRFDAAGIYQTSVDSIFFVSYVLDSTAIYKLVVVPDAEELPELAYSGSLTNGIQSLVGNTTINFLSDRVAFDHIADTTFIVTANTNEDVYTCGFSLGYNGTEVNNIGSSYRIADNANASETQYISTAHIEGTTIYVSAWFEPVAAKLMLSSFDADHGTVVASTISQITVKGTTESSPATYKPFLFYKDGYLFLIFGKNSSGLAAWAKSYAVTDAGVITSAAVDSVTFSGDGAFGYPSAEYMGANTYAIVYRGTGSDGYFSTLTMDGSGDVTNVETYEFNPTNCYYPTLGVKRGSPYAFIAYAQGVASQTITINSILVDTTTADITQSVIANTSFKVSDWSTAYPSKFTFVQGLDSVAVMKMSVGSSPYYFTKTISFYADPTDGSCKYLCDAFATTKSAINEYYWSPMYQFYDDIFMTTEPGVLQTFRVTGGETPAIPGVDDWFRGFVDGVRQPKNINGIRAMKVNGVR